MASSSSRYHASESLDWDHDDRKDNSHGFELKGLKGARTFTYMSTDSEIMEANSAADQPLVGHEGAPRKQPVTETTELQFSRSPSTEKPSRTWRRKLQGWRFGLALNTSTATLTLVMNIMLVAIAAYKFELVDGIGSLYVGDCDVVDRCNMGMHVLINALSSILLSASNYTMQCVTSPTRSECDAAHARGDWLDIGIAGTRNLKKIGFQRRVVWFLLALSSLPIHLLYNSAVFKTLDANNHRYAVVGDQFLDAPALNESQLTNRNRGMETTRLQYHEDPQTYERLDPEACISAYRGPFVSGHSNVLLVTSDDQYDYSVRWPPLYGVITIEDIGYGGDWLCKSFAPDGSCGNTESVSASNWTVLNYKIDYCLARKTEPHCKLQFSLYIMIPVMICNLIKAATMVWTLLRQREITFVTFGDALASWLERPDESTSQCCLMGREEYIAFHKSRRAQRTEYEAVPMHTSMDDAPPPTTFSHRSSRRWSDAVSSKRWSVTMIFCTSAIIVACILLIIATEGAAGGSSFTTLGFGSFRPDAIVNIGIPKLGTTGLIGCVLLANLPQLVLSVLYLMYNGLYTCMHLAHEYSGYATERKPLRVTEPKGDQRSTYWIQLPYTYGLPLLVASSLLHWLVSQSIFLARVTVWQDAKDEVPIEAEGRNNYEYTTNSTIGYSCAPMLCAILLGATLLFVAFLVGYRKLPGHMPVAGSCSAALSAAAHRPKSDVDASVLPVKWGVVTGSATTIGHVCFTSEEVTDPQEGKPYAGRENLPSGTDVGFRARNVWQTTHTRSE